MLVSALPLTGDTFMNIVGHMLRVFDNVSSDPSNSYHLCQRVPATTAWIWGSHQVRSHSWESPTVSVSQTPSSSTSGVRYALDSKSRALGWGVRSGWEHVCFPLWLHHQENFVLSHPVRCVARVASYCRRTHDRGWERCGKNILDITHTPFSQGRSHARQPLFSIRDTVNTAILHHIPHPRSSSLPDWYSINLCSWRVHYWHPTEDHCRLQGCLGLSSYLP
jgi:hypothetical protein